VSIKHKRKDGYWLYYHLAHTVERDTVIENIVLSGQGKSSSMFKECQQQQKRKKTSTLMGETCLYLYFDGCIWFDLS
jgi:metal-responsive CopG/Arc/MetJ family transcriptional regulator